MKKISIYSILFLILTFNVFSGPFELSTVYLTWEKNPEKTMTVQWLTKDKENPHPFVRYRLKGTEAWYVQQGSAKILPGSDYIVNKVLIDELVPNSSYEFRINLETEQFVFRTAPKDLDPSTQFIVGGDMYHDTIEDMRKTTFQAAKADPLFVVIGGDIAYVYKSGSVRFNRWIEWVQMWHKNMIAPDNRLIPVLASIGNHDLSGQYDQSHAEAADFAALFPMPGSKAFNVLDFGDYLSVFLLDSGHANPASGAQADWLKRALQERSKIKHKFPIYHIPAYPSYRTFKNERSARIRDNWVPIFEANKIKVAFEHHDHCYKRSFPMLQNKVNQNGVIYLGDGAWGVDKPRERSDKVFPYYLEKVIPVRHFILVKISQNQSEFKCIDEDGKIVDELKL